MTHESRRARRLGPPEVVDERDPRTGRFVPALPVHHGHVVRDFNSLEALVEHERGNGATHVLALGKNTVIYYPTGRYWPTGQPQYEAGKAYPRSGYWHATAPSARTALSGPLHGGAQTIEDFLARHRHDTRESVDERDPRTGRFVPSHPRGPARLAAGPPRLEAGGRHRRLTGYEAIEYAERTGRTLSKYTDPTEEARVGINPDEARAIAAHDPSLVYIDVGSGPAGHAVRDYEAVDSRGRRVGGPFKHYDDAKQEANRSGGVVRFVVGDRAAERPYPHSQTMPPRHRHHAHEAARRRHPHGGPTRRPSPRALSMTSASVLAVASELSRRVHGSAPKYVGPHRWSDPNESATFVTYSPVHAQPVVVLVSVFRDGTLALDFFSSESRSELDRYENIGNFLYRTADYGEMVADLKWVWDTVDGYAESWGAGQETEESRAKGASGRLRVAHTSMGWYVERPLPGGTAVPLAGPYATRHQASTKRDELERQGRGGKEVEESRRTARSRAGRTFDGLDEYLQSVPLGVASRHRHRSGLHPREADRMEASRRRRPSAGTETAGARYAREQIESDYFREWVFDQMAEAHRMQIADPRSVIPLKTPTDWQTLARNMLQQLEWDTKRDMDLRDILAAAGVDSEGSAQDSAVAREFFQGFTEELRKPRVRDSLARMAKEMKKTLDDHERSLERGRRATTTERRGPRLLLPPGPR
jgi:hypothetical protein